MIPIPADLRDFANVFPAPLYVVGGYVRDALRGKISDDIDICSPLSATEVENFMQGTKYRITLIKRDTGTVSIRSGTKEWQYTAFRTDVYKVGHTPVSTAPADILGDAKRRDFKANAVYYDVKNDVLVDPLGGIKDIDNKVLSTTRPPQEVFSEDGLRLMRLARLASEIGFTPSAETLTGARENAEKIREIAPERIRVELERILQSEKPSVGLRLLYDEGIMQIILPEIADGYGMPQRSDFHKFDVFGHIMATVDAADPSVRTAALFHDIGKPACYRASGNYHGHDVVGAEICNKVMNRLRYPKAVIKEVERLVLCHMYDLSGDAGENKVRKFVQKNADIIDKICLIKNADFRGCAGSGPECKSASATRLSTIYAEMKKEGVPFSIKDLLVRGDELPEEIVPLSKRTEALNRLLEACAVKGSLLTTKEKQLQYIINDAKGR